MYTVIVADDEEEIRKGIIRKVRWQKLGFKVIGEAENGADALELTEKLEPDLLLTDIRMPFLSGLELARQIREVRPMVQIIFLSGYDDFSYAQEAIQYNIISYLLKPISSRELEEELLKAKEIIDGQYAEFTRTLQVQKEMEKSEFLMSLLLDGFRMRTDESELIENALSCGLLRNKNTERLRYVVIVVEITDENGRDQITHASVDAIDTILKKYILHASCYMKGRVVSVLAATKSGFHKYLHILAEEIVQSVERILQMKCLVGVSRSAETLADCRECYIEAMNAISYSKKYESNVYFIADEEKNEQFSQENFQEKIDRIEKLLRGGKREELEEYLEYLDMDMVMGKQSIMWMNLLISQIVASVFRVVYTAAGEEAVQELQMYSPFQNARGMEQVVENFQKMKELCLAAKSIIAEQRKKSSEIICDKVLKIIEDRYMDQDLAVLSVSQEISVTPNYLSALIKKVTGRTFVELLTERRIEKAQELLLCTSMKIREITEVCGYKDQYYFSHCFKKITGMSPNACRKLNEEKQR